MSEEGHTNIKLGAGMVIHEGTKEEFIETMNEYTAVALETWDLPMEPGIWKITLELSTVEEVMNEVKDADSINLTNVGEDMGLTNEVESLAGIEVKIEVKEVPEA